MSAPIRVRLGELYEQQLAQAGPNLSASLRAFMLVGMAAAGINMIPFRREIARALAEDLAPELLAALKRIEVARPSTPTRPLSEAELEPVPDGDPLLAVGYDV